MFLKVSQIRKYRVFRNFFWQAPLPEFARYNVIYGWNGSGKTTLSLLFQALERRQNLPDGECVFVFDSGSIKSNRFSSDDPRPSVRVFNRIYIDETVFRSSRPGLPSIFYVAKESKEKQQRIEEISIQLLGEDGNSGLVGKILEMSGNEQRARKELDDFAISKAAEIKAELRSSDSTRFNNYDKRDFMHGIERLLSRGDAPIAASILDERAHREARQKKETSRQPEIALGALSKVDLSGLVDEVRDCLKETVVSTVLERLSRDSEAEQWVRAGLPLHNIGTQNGADKCCLFCQQELTQVRISALEAHFNDNYQRFLRRIGDLQNKVRNLQARLSGIRLPVTAELAPHLREEFTPAREAYELLIDGQKAVVGALDDAMNDKIRRPFDAMLLDDYLKSAPPNYDQLNQEADRIERQVIAHNQFVGEFQQTITSARDAIEAHMLATAAEMYVKLKATLQAIKNETIPLREQKTILEEERDRLDRSIREDRIPADELSQELSAFLGRNELKFIAAGSGYSIMRGDVTADNLSEGEKTAIAFLYFLKSLSDTSFNISTGVVVVDDPVSSLDANSLFCAFAYLSKRTVDAAQLILLTHNFLFLKQVKDWFKHLKNAKNSVSYYMIENFQDLDGRSARIAPMDNLIKDYQSEYHFLFRKVLDGSQQQVGLPLEHYYGLPNVARRLLEVFLGFRFPAEHGFKSRLEKINADPATIARIRRFVHTYSHEEGDGEEIDATMLSEAPAVLRSILDLIQTEDKRHFDQMKAICTAGQ